MKRTGRAIANVSKKHKTGLNIGDSVSHARQHQTSHDPTAQDKSHGTSRMATRSRARLVDGNSVTDDNTKPDGCAEHLCKDAGKEVARKPPKFSWVVDGLLAGQGRPTLHGHVKYLCDNGFKYLVTLTINKPRALQEYPGRGLTWVHIPINDEQPPSIEQIQAFVDTVENAKKDASAVAVHCAWGRGRTGTMLACYLAHARGLPAQEAITEIRKLRPGSIDTEQQVQAVQKWAEHIQQSSSS